jgi:hypothetical protein
MPIIPAIWETGQEFKKLSEKQTKKKERKKKDWGHGSRDKAHVKQARGPEFKPQYHQKKFS